MLWGAGRILAGTGVALAALVTAGDARAGQVVARVDGPVLALAQQGDAVLVARQPRGQRVVVERIGPDGSRVVLARLPGREDEQDVRLAASPEVVAVAAGPTQTGSFLNDDTRSEVLVAGPGAPLVRVASCSVAGAAPAVAVDGGRVAFGEGGCAPDGGTGSDAPTPATVVVRDLLTGAPELRWPVGPVQLTGIALTAAGGYASSVDPAAVQDTGLGDLPEAVVELRPGGTTAPVTGLAPTARVLGALPDGRGVVRRTPARSASLAAEPTCDQQVGLIQGAVGTVLDLGTCVADAGDFSPSDRFSPGDDGVNVGVAADRVVSLQGSSSSSTPSVVSTRADGGDRRVLDPPSDRSPLLLSAAPGRVAWTRPGCDGTTEVVAGDPLGASVTRGASGCVLRLRTRSARVNAAGSIGLRFACPRGCTGRVADLEDRTSSGDRDFAFGDGTHSVRVRPSRRALRRGRVRLSIDVAGGGILDRTVRLRTPEADPRAGFSRSP